MCLAGALVSACARTGLEEVGGDEGASSPGAHSAAADASTAAAEASATSADGGSSMGPQPTGGGADSGGSGGCPSATHGSNGGCIPDDPGAALPSSAACLAGGNILWIDGDPDALIFEGTTTVAGGTWKAMPWDDIEWNSGAAFEITPSDATPETPPWVVNFTLSFTPEPQPIVLGTVYSPTIPSENTLGPELPVLNVEQIYACDQSEGAFRVDALTDSSDDTLLLSVTATFWLHCYGHKGLLRGCVHYGT
jgi:hypothetical protein